MKKLAVLAVMATVLTIAGCSQSPQGTKNSIPDAQTSANATGTAVDAANGHVAAAASHTASAQGDVRAAIPLTTEPATGKLHSADSSLSQTQAELTAAKAELAKAQSENQKTEKALQDAQSEKDKENKALADAEKYKAKYESQWFAGKFWRAFWTVVIGTSLIVVACLFLNFYTDIFVIPLKFLGGSISWFFSTLIKSAWISIGNLVRGIWGYFFKNKTDTPK